MDVKILILLLVAINSYYTCGAALRRTPKVYNALITTDENLTSSRAYPVIQPTIHETGYAHYPLGPYGPYGIYGQPLVRFGLPITPGLTPRQQIPYPLPSGHLPPQLVPQTSNLQPSPVLTQPAVRNPPTAPEAEGPKLLEPPQPEDSAAQQQPTELNAQPQPGSYMPFAEAPRPQQMPPEKLPIPLNELGLPPALVPLQQPQRIASPFHLPPYGYNQYPISYSPFTGFREQYLPPYEYFAGNAFSLNGIPTRQPLNPLPAPLTPNDATKAAPIESTQSSNPISALANFENIKNGSKSKDNDVPDVPPPPIPSGAKLTQS